MQTTSVDGARGPTSRGREALSFTLGRESYGIEILQVQEIRRYEPPTPIANAPAYAKGVINLRGRIVPVFDLRLKFNLPQAQYDAFTVVIIISVGGKDLGLVVDTVSDVVHLAGAAIQPPPQFASTVFDTRYITGMADVDGRMLVLLDIAQLMGDADLSLAHTAH